MVITYNVTRIVGNHLTAGSHSVSIYGLRLELYEEIVGIRESISQNDDETKIVFLERRELLIPTAELMIVGDLDAIKCAERISVIRTEDGFRVKAIEEVSLV